MSVTWGALTGLGGRLAAAAWLVACAIPTIVSAQSLTPSMLSPTEQNSLPPTRAQGAPAGSPGASLLAPRMAPSAPAPLTMPTTVPQGMVALALSARYGREPPPITGGLVWRVYTERPDPTGQFRLLKEERTPTPVFMLPPGGYIVYVSFGLANSVKRVQLRAETVRETFELIAGGARFEGRVGDSRIPGGQISFDVYRGTQLETGEKRPVAEGVASGDVVLLPEGTYHVVSNYGDGNAVMRSDLKISSGKLTDTVIIHRAAKIMLKLVGDKGGEALANTAWSVLTPGGDIIKESTGAFPIVILAEGDYVVIARNEGKVYNREFKVEPGFDREIEVIAR
jgi:hypothetical protein